MNVLIVHAHPEPKSFCTAMKDVLVAEFQATGYSVTVSDLYEEQFNPVASSSDFSAPSNPDYLVYALEQRHAMKQGTLPGDIAREVQRLKEADLVVLNFPLYWFSVPAILKGWIDRVFLSGLVYGGRNFYDRGLMKGKKAWVTFSLGGREHMFGPGSVHGPIEDMLKPLLRGSLGYAGFEVLQPFAAHHVPYISEEARRAILNDLKTACQQLPQRAALPMPSLANFDESMKPLAQ